MSNLHLLLRLKVSRGSDVDLPNAFGHDERLPPMEFFYSQKESAEKVASSRLYAPP